MQGSFSLQKYSNQYMEVNQIGRGNYGTAYLVHSHRENCQYVAKKIMLDGLTSKQLEAAWGEISILKKLSAKENKQGCPFIVEYKESFHSNNTLVIIMEYCQHGQLTSFLKAKKKKQQPLNQVVIVNWFIQMVFGVSYLHSKGVLHRDLKSGNIFLTSNKTIKIGDFGISKILDDTSAKTFVGTPYYLSPQVCENKPYSYKSDVWSLGCILYQMCTYSYPFQASNVLGLALKILKQKVPPIPNMYSSQLNDVVMQLLIKNQHERVSIEEIKTIPYVQSHILNFQKQKQIVNQTVLNVKVVKPTLERYQEQNENSKLTPRELFIKRKKQQADKKANELKQAALIIAQQRHFAKIKKQENLGRSGSIQSNQIDMTIKVQNQNQRKAQLKNTIKMQKNQALNLANLNKIIQNQPFNYDPNADIPTSIQLPYSTQYVSLQQAPFQSMYEEYQDQQFQLYQETFREVRPTTASEQRELELIYTIFSQQAKDTLKSKNDFDEMEKLPKSEVKKKTINKTSNQRIIKAKKDKRHQNVRYKSLDKQGFMRFIIKQRVDVLTLEVQRSIRKKHNNYQRKYNNQFICKDDFFLRQI